MNHTLKKGPPFTILLIEDNQAHAELVMRTLENHQIANKIYHVSNGEAALDYLFRRGNYANPHQSPRPYVILLDLKLPKIDGLTVLEQIKTNPELKSIPTIILTTSAAPQDVEQAYARHVNSYLVKPADYKQFTRLLNDFGFYWLDINYQASL